jgi:hypothetical protein
MQVVAKCKPKLCKSHIPSPPPSFLEALNRFLDWSMSVIGSPIMLLSVLSCGMGFKGVCVAS